MVVTGHKSRKIHIESLAEVVAAAVAQALVFLFDSISFGLIMTTIC